MPCPSCGHDNPAEARFRMSCGQTLRQAFRVPVAKEVVREPPRQSWVAFRGRVLPEGVFDVPICPATLPGTPLGYASRETGGI